MQVRSLQSQREPMSEVAASVRVLGISYEEQGLGVANRGVRLRAFSAACAV